MSQLQKYINFNRGWEFRLDEDLSFSQIQNTIKLKDWEKIELPHDWSISLDFNMNSLSRNEGGLLDGGFGYYKKKFYISETIQDKKIFIRFGGVYMDSSVWVNDRFVGNYPFGYLDFIYDISDFVLEGDNTIVVKVEHRQPSSRWYSGSGIYRNVDLIIKNKVNFVEDELKILHHNLEENIDGVVKSQVTYLLENDTPKDETVLVEHEILDSQGMCINKFIEYKNILADSRQDFTSYIEVEKPKLWDLEQPNLYYLKSTILLDGKVVDQVVNRYGYRFFDWTHKDGFSLNGKYLKLHGVCMHHDNGALGAVQDTSSEYRKIMKLKSMGVNSIRTSHNPQSREFVKLCEENGILLLEEAFDTWHGQAKKEYDYNRYFHRRSTHKHANGRTWAEHDLARMVKRDFNSPAVFMWSIGNEIWESKEKFGIDQAKLLIKTIKDIDKSRYVTIGENGYNGGFEKDSVFVEISDLLDTVGLNYAEKTINDIKEERPNWLFYGAETSSSVKSRGIYYDPSRKDNIITGNHDKVNRKYQVSDYGNDRVSWGSTAIDSWIPDRDNKGYAGQYVWTGYDYIGEPTPWHNEENLGAPSKSSYFGILDTCGFAKMDFYFYKSQWVSQEVDPFVKILPHWNFEDKDLLKSLGTDLKRNDNKVPVRVYSNIQEVELFLNNRSLGKKSFNKKVTDYGLEYFEGQEENELYLEWLVEFEKGELKAVGYSKNGQVKDLVITAGKAKKVSLGIDYSSYLDKNMVEDVQIGKSTFIKFDIVDKDGNIVPTGSNMVEFEIEGGQILGTDNGDGSSQERYKSQKDGSFKRSAFSGSGLLIIKPDHKKIILRAKSEGLEGCELVLHAEESRKSKDYKISKDLYTNSWICSECYTSIEENNIKPRERHEFIVAKNKSLAIKSGNQPLLPLETEIYTIEGEKKIAEVKSYDRVDSNIYMGHVENGLDFKVWVRMSDQTRQSYNYAQAWNGSEIPAGFASFTNLDEASGDSVLKLNNSIVSFDDRFNDKWTNKSHIFRKNDYVGILFGRAGKLEKHTISKIRVAFYKDNETDYPINYVLKYYKDDIVSIPKNYANMDEDHELNDNDRYLPIEVIKEYKEDGYMVFEFEDIATFAIRLDMIAQNNKAIGISEIEAYGQTPHMNVGFDINIKVDGKEIVGFDKEIDEYRIKVENPYVNAKPMIEVETTNNAAYTIIQSHGINDYVTIIVNDEADMEERIYKIFIEK